MGRKAQVASSILWVRNRPECPEDNLRELMKIATQSMGFPERTKKQKSSCERI